MNDAKGSYAKKFGGLPYDFNEAVKYYVRTTKEGSFIALENLGSHYKTGMIGNVYDRVDHEKTVYYNRGGMKTRCCKCTFILRWHAMKGWDLL